MTLRDDIEDMRQRYRDESLALQSQVAARKAVASDLYHILEVLNRAKEEEEEEGEKEQVDKKNLLATIAIAVTPNGQPSPVFANLDEMHEYIFNLSRERERLARFKTSVNAAISTTENMNVYIPNLLRQYATGNE